jgi:hypothetical protein
MLAMLDTWCVGRQNDYYYPPAEVDVNYLQFRANFAQFVRRLPENENVYKDVGINGKSPLLSLAHESVHFTLGVPYAGVHVVSVASCKIVQRLWWGVYVFDQKPDYLGPTDS